MLPKIEQLQPYQGQHFFLIAGPCVVEDEQTVMHIAEHLRTLTNRLQVPFIFKASYRKANRSSGKSFTGIGDEKALKILAKVKKEMALPVVTDIHSAPEATMAAEFVDVLQIPAFLCRQSDLLEAAAQTGKWVNIKKGQFLSGEAMRFPVEKVKEAGNEKVMVTDRGNSFGYTDIIVDYRNIVAMNQLQVPVIMDCTHSLQQPNQSSGVTGGKPELIETIAKCGIAAGADGLFIETHSNPSVAKSDGANMLRLELMEDLLKKCIRVFEAVQ
jgi:2-dehydro-3-deoxyphosphooctonate aldolase (KDO 8-P synthase)